MMNKTKLIPLSVAKKRVKEILIEDRELLDLLAFGDKKGVEKK